MCVCVCASVCTLTVANNMQNTATHCNTTGLSGYSPDESQNRAVCNTLQYMCTPTGASNSTYCWGSVTRIAQALQHTATRCITLQRTATHSVGTVGRLGRVLAHSLAHCNSTLHHSNSVLQRTATHDTALQHTTTHCNTQYRRSWQPGSSASNTHKFVSTYAHTLSMIQNLYDAHATEGKIYDRREGGSFVGEVGK